MPNNSIKTIMTVENTDVKTKLDQLKKSYSETFNSILNLNEKTAKKSEELSAATDKVARARRLLAMEQAKGDSANKERIATLKETIKETSRLVTAIRAEKAALSSATQAQREQNKHNREAAQAIRVMNNEVNASNKSAYQQWNHFIRMARWGGTLVGVYYALTRAWGATIGVGIGVNRTVENNTNGIAALIAANTMLTTSTGKTVDVQTRFMMGQALSAEIVKKLRKAAVETAGTFEDMVMVFQQGFAQTIAMGNSFGGSIEEITNNTITLSQRMMNIAGAIGMPMDRVREEIRSLLSANASTDSLIASMLFGSPAQANEAVRRAKDLGEGALNAMLGDKLGAFDVLKGLPTYDIQLARLKDSYMSLMASISKPIFSDMTQFFTHLSGVVAGKDLVALEEQTRNLYETLKTSVKWISEIAVAFTAWRILVPVVQNISALSTAVGVFTAGEVLASTAANTTAGAITRMGLAATVAGGQITRMGAMAVGARAAMVGLSATAWPLILGVTALIGLYEAYNFLIADSAKEEEALHRILNTKKDDLKELTDAQIRLNKGIVDQAISEKTLELSRAKVRVANDPKNDKARVEKESLQKELDTLQSYSREMGKVVRERTALVAQLKALGNGQLQVSGLDKKFMGEAVEYVERTLPQQVKITQDLAKAEKQLAIARKEKDLAAEKNLLAYIAQKNKELTELKEREGAKAGQARNKEAREELSLYALKRQSLETQMAMYGLIEAQKADTSKLDESRISETDRLKLASFQLEIQHNAELLDEAVKLKDAKNRENQINIINEKTYKTLTELQEYRLKLQKDLNDNLEKESLKRDRMALKEYERLDKLQTLKDKQFRESPAFERTFGTSKISPETADAWIAKRSATYQMATWGITNPDVLAQAEARFNETIERIKNQIAELPPVEFDFHIEGWNDFSDGLAEIIGRMGDLGTVTEKYNEQSKLAKDGSKEQHILDFNYTKFKLDSYGQMIGAASKFYKAESTEAKRLYEIEKVMHAANMAMTAAELISAGTLGVASQAKLTFPFNLAAMAATGAALAAIGVMVGGAFGGGGSETYDSYASQTANTGAGTVLGDSKAQTESISKALKTLSDLARPEYRLLSEMSDSLQSIDDKIGGLSANILQSAGFAVGGSFSGSSSGSFGNDVKSFLQDSTLGSLISVGPVGTAIKKLDIPILSDLAGALNDIVGWAVGGLIEGIFGGGSETTLHDAGLQFTDQFLTAAIAGLDGSAYQTAKTVKDGGWFRGDKTSYKTYFDDLDEYTKNQFELVLKNLYDVTVASSDALDSAQSVIQAALSDYTVTLGKISLKDKTGEEIQAILTSVFGKVGDEIAAKAYPGLEPFQQIGEGMFDTLARVAVGMEEAEYYIDRLGMAFDDIVYTDLVNKQGDVAVEALKQSILGLEASAYGAENGISQIIDLFSGTAEETYVAYTALNGFRYRMAYLGESAAAVTSDLIRGAGGLTEFEDAMSGFFSNFLSESKNFIYNTWAISEAFADIGLTMPKSKEGFVDLVRGIDTTTAAGQELYGRAIALSDSFMSVASMAENLDDSMASVREYIFGKAPFGFDQYDAFATGNTEYDTLITKVQEAYDYEKGLLEDQHNLEIDNLEKLRDSISKIKDFADDILYDNRQTAIPNQYAYRYLTNAIKEFNATFAAGGDTSAIFSDIQKYSQDYIGYLQATSKTDADYNFALAALQNKLRGLGGGSGDPQLDAIDAGIAQANAVFEQELTALKAEAGQKLTDIQTAINTQFDTANAYAASTNEQMSLIAMELIANGIKLADGWFPTGTLEEYAKIIQIYQEQDLLKYQTTSEGIDYWVTAMEDLTDAVTPDNVASAIAYVASTQMDEIVAAFAGLTSQTQGELTAATSQIGSTYQNILDSLDSSGTFLQGIVDANGNLIDVYDEISGTLTATGSSISAIATDTIPALSGTIWTGLMELASSQAEASQQLFAVLNSGLYGLAQTTGDGATGLLETVAGLADANATSAQVLSGTIWEVFDGNAAVIEALTTNTVTGLEGLVDSTDSVGSSLTEGLGDLGRQISVLTGTLFDSLSDASNDIVRSIGQAASGIIDTLTATRYNNTGELTMEGLVSKMYTVGIGRTPDAGGFSYWMDQIGKGLSLTDLVNSFKYAAKANGEPNFYGGALPVQVSMSMEIVNELRAVKAELASHRSVLDSIDRNSGKVATNTTPRFGV